MIWESIVTAPLQFCDRYPDLCDPLPMKLPFSRRFSHRSGSRCADREFWSWRKEIQERGGISGGGMHVPALHTVSLCSSGSAPAAARVNPDNLDRLQYRRSWAQSNGTLESMAICDAEYHKRYSQTPVIDGTI